MSSSVATIVFAITHLSGRIFRLIVLILVLPHKNSKSHKNNGITKDVAKIILTALVAFIFSSAFWVAILPNNTLTITIPPQDENKTSTVTANTFPIEWELETQQWFTKGVDRKSPANIRVLKDGLFEVQSLEAQVPGITIELDSGIYDLEVISIETDVSDKMRVIVSP